MVGDFISATRSTIVKQLQAQGAIVSTKLTSKTDAVLAGCDSDQIVKQAWEMNIPIYTDRDIRRLIRNNCDE